MKKKKKYWIRLPSCQSRSIGREGTRKGQIGLFDREEEKGHEKEGEGGKGRGRDILATIATQVQYDFTLRQVCLVDHLTDRESRVSVEQK